MRIPLTSLTSITNGLLACFCVWHSSKPSGVVTFLFTAKAVLDFLLHVARVLPMKTEYCLHHVLLLLWSVHYVRVDSVLHLHPAHQAWWTCLNLAEVSSIFLSLLELDRSFGSFGSFGGVGGVGGGSLLPKKAKTIVQLLFAFTFLYFRILSYAQRMLLPLHLSPLQEYTNVVSMVAGSVHAHIFQLSMHAFFVLNLYWAWKLMCILLLPKKQG